MSECWVHNCPEQAEVRGMYFSCEERLVEFLLSADAEYCEIHADYYIRNNYFVPTDLI